MRQISILDLLNEFSDSIKVFFSFELNVVFNLGSIVWNLYVINDMLYLFWNMNLWGWFRRLLDFIFHILMVWMNNGFLVGSWGSTNTFSWSFITKVFCFVWSTCIKISSHWSVWWFHCLSHAWCFWSCVLFL